LGKKKSSPLKSPIILLPSWDVEEFGRKRVKFPNLGKKRFSFIRNRKILSLFCEGGKGPPFYKGKSPGTKKNLIYLSQGERIHSFFATIKAAW